MLRIWRIGSRWITITRHLRTSKDPQTADLPPFDVSLVPNSDYCESSLASTSLEQTLDEKYADYTDDKPSLVCTICLSEVRNGERVGLLSCTHVFHSSCLKDWLRRKNACPLCRALSAAEVNTLERGSSRTDVRIPQDLAPNDPPNEHEPDFPAARANADPAQAGMDVSNSEE